MADYIPAIAGGLLIGAAAALLLVLMGRVAGISGVFYTGLTSIVKLDFKAGAWRVAFVVGLIFGPLVVHNIFGVPVPNAPEGSLVLAIVGGLLVGFGTRIGAGCTSGHGICGMARLSTRSIVATVTFMFAGFVTVFVVRHLIA